MKKWMILLLSGVLLCALSLSAWAFEASGDTVYTGIDVSVWQGEIDFAQVAADGIEVVYIRAGEGSDYTDPYLEQNYQGAQENGLLIGFYHYVTATGVAEAQEEARFFASLVADKDYDCLLAMDYESFSGSSVSTVNAVALAFLQELQQATGAGVMIYSDLSNARNIFSSALADYPLWIAEYEVEEPNDPGTWDSWVGFQYSDSGSVAGITANVDLNRFTDGVLLNSTGGSTSGGGTGNGSSEGGTDSGMENGSGSTDEGDGDNGSSGGTDSGSTSMTVGVTWLLLSCLGLVAMALMMLAVTAALREWRERQARASAATEADSEPTPQTATLAVARVLPYNLEELEQREIEELQNYRQREFEELQTLQQERERRELERLERLVQAEIQALAELQQQALIRQQELWALREQIIAETPE